MKKYLKSFSEVAVAVGILLSIANLIPSPQVTSFIMLVRRSLSNAGAKVEELLLRSKLFTNYFSFIFSRQAMYYNVRIKEKKKIQGGFQGSP